MRGTGSERGSMRTGYGETVGSAVKVTRGGRILEPSGRESTPLPCRLSSRVRITCAARSGASALPLALVDLKPPSPSINRRSARSLRPTCEEPHARPAGGVRTHLAIGVVQHALADGMVVDPRADKHVAARIVQLTVAVLLHRFRRRQASETRHERTSYNHGPQHATCNNACNMQQNMQHATNHATTHAACNKTRRRSARAVQPASPCPMPLRRQRTPVAVRQSGASGRMAFPPH